MSVMERIFLIFVLIEGAMIIASLGHQLWLMEQLKKVSAIQFRQSNLLKKLVDKHLEDAILELEKTIALENKANASRNRKR